MSTIRIYIGSIRHWAEFCRKEQVQAWCSMEALMKELAYPWQDPFREGAPTELVVSLDATCIKDFITLVCENEQSKFPIFEASERENKTETPLYMDMIYSQSQTSPRPDFGIGLLLQDMFLCMNIAHPGSCCLFGAFAKGDDYEFELIPTPDGERFYAAQLLCDKWQWPNLEAVSPSPIQVWEWLGLIDFRANYFAESSAQRALMALLEASSKRDGAKASTVVELVQALENLYISERTGLVALFRDRIQSVLGAPRTHTKWATRLYEMRSRIAHGSFPSIRPVFYDDFCEKYGGIIGDLLDAEDRAFLTLLATIRDLVLTGSDSYAFTTSFVRNKAGKD